MSLIGPAQDVDPRTKLQKARRHEIAAHMRGQGRQTTREDGTDMTKEELLVEMQVKNYRPETYPLGGSPASVPYEDWKIQGLRVECKKRGIKSQNTWDTTKFGEILRAHDQEVLGDM